MDPQTLIPSREAVSCRAHKIWEAGGRTDGRELDHWLQAEQELRDEAESNQKLENAVKDGDGSDSDHGNSIAYSRAAAMAAGSLAPGPIKPQLAGQKGKKRN
jgi:hypothetical protein